MNRSLKKDQKLPSRVYNTLRYSSGSIPSVYGLPKVHKPGVPLRPFISFCTSPTYNLSKHLVLLLSPLLGNTSSNVRNSFEFVEFIQQETLGTNEVLVSFDVVSLFTKIPVLLALNVAHQCLESLSECTALTVDDSISLLSLCLNATCF